MCSIVKNLIELTCEIRTSAFAGRIAEEAEWLPACSGNTGYYRATYMSFQLHAVGGIEAADSLPVPPELPKGLRVTKVFDTFWRFAAERQEIFFNRLACSPPPWTDDEILRKNKFTNVYRASDRVSQYLIKNVIPSGSPSERELFFRIILFKLFNRIETWELLLKEFGEISWGAYSFERYDVVLSRALELGQRVYSAAYIMPSGGKADRKHRHHLQLLERMLNEAVPSRLQACKTMQEGFELLRSYPSIGDFLAYQFVTDLNYGEITDFSEMEFVKPGPGARDGMKKCFEGVGSSSPQRIIRWMVDTQEAQFRRVGVRFRTLWGRRLQLIDCQNVFCEVDKYARHAHPEFTGVSGRSRIKQRFKASPGSIEYFYPPKWRINQNVQAFGAGWGQSASVAEFNAAD